MKNARFWISCAGFSLGAPPAAFIYARKTGGSHGYATPKFAAQIDNPATAFEKPRDVVADSKLSLDDKKAALNAWEQDARQLMTASNEGMPGAVEGLDPDDHHRMAEVVRAKETLGEKPTQKPAH